MGSEAELEAISTPKLPLLAIPPMQSPERSGMLTPLHTLASVPFRWEEEPGKPRRSCTTLVTTTHSDDQNKCLELPPRLQFMDSKMTKMPSPTGVLDGPYAAVGMPLFPSSNSFRFRRERRQGSFGSSCGSPERGQLGAMVLSKRPESKERSGISLGSWGRKTNLQIKRLKKEVRWGSFDFSSPTELADFDGGGGGGGGGEESGSITTRMKTSRIRRNYGSFSGLSQVRSPFWANIYEGFKQVLPWKSRKLKKEGLIII